MHTLQRLSRGTHSSCHAFGARYLPSCCSPVSLGLAPGPCTSSGWVHGRPREATKAHSRLNMCTEQWQCKKCHYKHNLKQIQGLTVLVKKRLTYNVGNHDSRYIMSNHGKYKTATAHHHAELGNTTRRNEATTPLCFKGTEGGSESSISAGVPQCVRCKTFAFVTVRVNCYTLPWFCCLYCSISCRYRHQVR